MANTYGRQVVIPLTNKSGGGVIAGDVVIVDTANNDAFTTTTSAAFTGLVGIAQGTIASNAVGPVLISGYAALVNVNASVTRGHYGATHTVAKQAADAGASRTNGTFCQFLTGGTTPDATVFNPDFAVTAGGSITASGYTQNTAKLLGRTTASSGAIEEISVGTGLSLSAGSLSATGGGATLYHDTTTRTVTNTTTETDVFPAQSITGGVLGTTGSFRITLIANVNHAIAGTCTIRVYYGATVIGTVALDAGFVGASKDIIITGLIANLGAANSQQYGLIADGRDGTAGATYVRTGLGTAAADTSTTGNFKITAQWGSASASLTYTQYVALIEVLV